jgi:hypothetical protein
VPEETIVEADAIRFTYRWVAADGTCELVDATRVAMTALPGIEIDPAGDPYSGYWYELRDAAGTMMWCLPARNPLSGEVESLTGDGPSNVANDTPEGTVVAVIPNLAGATTVAVMGSPPLDPGSAAAELVAHAYAEFP